MELKQFGEFAVQYGLGIMLSAGMAWFMGWVLKFVLLENSKREEKNQIALTSLASIINGSLETLTKKLELHDDNSRGSNARNEEALKRNRDEHDSMMKIMQMTLERNQAMIIILNKIADKLNKDAIPMA